MNSNNKNANKMNTSSNRQVYKTFCKVCQDSGKTEKEYTSHNVRDARGNTCCPTLLAQECRNCYQKGHTSKYCKLAAPLATKRETVRGGSFATTSFATTSFATTSSKTTSFKQEQVKQVKNPVTKNVYMCFDDSEGDDNDSEKEKEKEYSKTIPAPVLKAELKVTQTNALNYGKIIALAPEIVKKEEVAAFIKESNKVFKPPKIVVAHAPMQAPFRWADCDSGSEGDEDESEVYEDNSAW